MWVYFKHNNAMVRLFMVLLTLVALPACSDDNADSPHGQTVTPSDTTDVDQPGIPDRTLSYLALGDSYTIGTGVAESERFPVQLVTRLHDDGYDILPAEIIATNGWTTGNLLGALNNFEPDSAFSMVSLLIGVNNQFQGRPIEEYEDHFDQLLRKTIQYAGNDTVRVFVISIPDYGVTPFGQSMNPEEIAMEIDAFNTTNQNITESYGVSYYYITDISREAGANPALIAQDNLHPSVVQYALWIDLFESEIKDKLNE
jgi:lysophospholipase L1-like esterase